MLRFGSIACGLGVLFGLVSLASGDTGTGLFLLLVGGLGFLNYRYTVFRSSAGDRR